jgi:predicted MFS family arabinose efflux permease
MSEPAALRLPTAFKRLAWSNLAAQSAEQIGLAAAPIVAVLALGAREGETGLLQTAQTLPFLLFSFAFGVLADRTSRRRLMACAEAVRAVSLLVILALLLGRGLSFGMLALLGFLGASGTVAYGVTAPSLVPALVARAHLAAANAKLEVARTTAFIAGPALAGALISGIGASAAFALAAALSIAAVALFAGLDEPARPKLPPRHIFHDLREGTGFVFAHHLLRPILLSSVVFNISFFIIQAVYVPYAVHRLGLSAAVIGMTLAANGIGLVGGALIAPRLVRRMRFGWFITVGPVSGFLAAALMALTIAIPSRWLAGFSYFVMGIGPMMWIIGTATLRQVVTPLALLGRVSAVVLMATQGARPVGAAIGAVLGGAMGAETCLVVAMAGFLAQAIIVLISPIPRLAEQPSPAE